MAVEKASSFGWRNFVSHLSSVGVVVLCVGLVAGAAFGLRPLEARAASYNAGHRTQVVIEWPLSGLSDKPGASPDQPRTWLPRDEQQRLEEVARGALGMDDRPYTPEALARVGSALDATGWYEVAPEVRRVSPGTLVVRGRWRIPAAVVRSGGQDHLISWDAMPLAPVYKPGKATLPAVLDPAKGPPRDSGGERTFGTPWQGEDVGAALELIRTVIGQRWAAQVAGIDVSRYATEGTLVMVTRKGNRVVWGGRPSRPRLGEVSTKQKLIHLSQLQNDFKSIDAGYPLIYVNTDRLQFDTSASAAEDLKDAGVE